MRARIEFVFFFPKFKLRELLTFFKRHRFVVDGETHPSTMRNKIARSVTGDITTFNFGETIKTNMARRWSELLQPNVILSKVNDTSIHESYHLDGCLNYEVWAYQMKHVLEKDDLFTYCTNPPNIIMVMTKIIERKQTMNTLNSNVKNMRFNLMKHYDQTFTFVG
jgi:hypothetical protein